jgi:predicted Rossmann fold nucleotide-binding protein DprA/Smf involved in DNA uptake
VTQDTSPDTQATLLLVATLATSTAAPADPILKPAEYRRIRAHLAAKGHRLGDLLGPDAATLVEACADIVPPARLHALLGRGFRLAQALDQWAARSIWVVGTDDAAYPSRLHSRFGTDAPPLLYGCGNVDLLEAGGLAVVGSRDCDDETLAWTTEIGRRAARSRCTVVSGGARGVDLTAMRASLDAGGTATGVIADNLFREVLDAGFRDHLQAGTLVLVSANDPRQRFFASLRMQRNKYIYAMADAALVVATGFKEGGTWAGANEQLRHLRHVPVFVRVPTEPSPGLDALRTRGARTWPDPATPAEFARIVRGATTTDDGVGVPDTSTRPLDGADVAPTPAGVPADHPIIGRGTSTPLSRASGAGVGGGGSNGPAGTPAPPRASRQGKKAVRPPSARQATLPL